MAKRVDVPFDFKINTLVQETDEHGLAYEAITYGDDRGWERKSVLFARGGGWSSGVVNQPLVTLENHDGQIEITVHKPGREQVKFELSLCDLCDVLALIEVVKNDTTEIPYFPNLKVGQVSKKRRKNEKAK